jgi:type IV secretion system protein VirB10
VTRATVNAKDVAPSSSTFAERSVNPSVRLPPAGPSAIVIGLGLAVLAVLLFVILEAGRQKRIQEPQQSPGLADQDGFVPPPPLSLPPLVQESAIGVPTGPVTVRQRVAAVPAIVSAPNLAVQSAPPEPYYPPPAPTQAREQPVVAAEGARPSSTSQSSPMVVDVTVRDTGPPLADVRRSREVEGGEQQIIQSVNPTRAVRARDLPTTILQGTLIPAVLETPVDTSRPGFARAIVTRDASGFDGTKVLIPRGSRLIGQYRSVAAGQSRAHVIWERLIRPDGASIILDSPSGDPLGQAGVGGRVNRHTLSRIGGAILQTALTAGASLATPRSNAPFIYGLPSSLNISNGGSERPPVIKIKQGAQVTVFVARDLEFAGLLPRR